MRKQIVICNWLPIGDGFWVKGGDLRFLLVALGPDLLQTLAGPVGAASVSEFVCAFALPYLEGLVSLVSSVTSGSSLFPPLLLQASLGGGAI